MWADHRVADLILKIANKCRILLEKIIMAEAGGEDEKGQILVGNVIMNRVRNASFPNSIYDVIFEEGQFTPIRNGAFDRAIPTASVRMAVDKMLNGIDESQGALFFRTIAGAEGSWHQRARKKLFDHGTHRFYE
jgi:N-acetylmuramoyl-L-alanine amidase